MLEQTDRPSADARLIAAAILFVGGKKVSPDIAHNVLSAPTGAFNDDEVQVSGPTLDYHHP